MRLRSPLIAVFVLALSMLCVASAWAQGPSRPPLLGGGSSTTGGASGESGSLSAKPLSQDESTREFPDTASSPEGNDKFASTVNENPHDQPGLSFPDTYEDPESAYGGTMKENRLRQMSGNLLSSEMSLFYLVMGLTDPATSDSFSKATQHSLSMVSNIYSQKLHEAAKESRMGGQGVERALSRMACVRQNLKAQKDAGEQFNWVKADAICRGAYDNSAPASGSSVVTGAAPTRTDYDRTQDLPSPATQVAEPVVKCADLQERQSFVDDYLFPGEQEFKLSSGGTWRFKPQELFKIRFGDVYSGLTPDSTKESQQRLYCDIPPERDSRRQHFELRNNLWRAFLTVLEERCKSAAEMGDNIARAYVPFDPAQRTTFWRVGSTQLGDTFNFATYQFKPATVDIIYEMFIAKELRDITPEACTKRLNPDQPENRIENLLAENVRVGGRLVRVRDEHRFVFVLLQFVTRGQMLDEARHWAQYLFKRENLRVAMTPEVEAQLAARIAAFVGAPNVNVIPDLIQQNLQSFKSFIQQVHQLGAEQSGQGGQGLVDAFAATQQSENGTLGSGIAGQGQ